MTNTAIAAQVIEMLRQVAPEMQPEAIEADVPFRRQMEFDSVDFLKFVLKVQNRFGLHIPEEHYPQLATVDGCVAYLNACRPR